MGGQRRALMIRKHSYRTDNVVFYFDAHDLKEIFSNSIILQSFHVYQDILLHFDICGQTAFKSLMAVAEIFCCDIIINRLLGGATDSHQTYLFLILR